MAVRQLGGPDRAASHHNADGQQHDAGLGTDLMARAIPPPPAANVPDARDSA